MTRKLPKMKSNVVTTLWACIVVILCVGNYFRSTGHIEALRSEYLKREHIVHTHLDARSEAIAVLQSAQRELTAQLHALQTSPHHTHNTDTDEGEPNEEVFAELKALYLTALGDVKEKILHQYNVVAGAEAKLKRIEKMWPEMFNSDGSDKPLLGTNAPQLDSWKAQQKEERNQEETDQKSETHHTLAMQYRKAKEMSGAAVLYDATRYLRERHAEE